MRVGQHRLPAPAIVCAVIRRTHRRPLQLDDRGHGVASEQVVAIRDRLVDPHRVPLLILRQQSRGDQIRDVPITVQEVLPRWRNVLDEFLYAAGTDSS